MSKRRDEINKLESEKQRLSEEQRKMMFNEVIDIPDFKKIHQTYGNVDLKLTINEQIKFYNDLDLFTKQYLDKIGIDFNTFINNESKISKNVISDDNSISNFIKTYKKMLSYKKGLENGLKGEQDTYNALQIFDYKAKILRNIITPLKDRTVEHDIIVISENGIYTLEIKYFSAKSATITKQGLVIVNHRRKNQNIVEQARRHTHSIKSMLANTEFANIPVYPIFIFSNDYCDIINQGVEIPVCYRNNVEKYIFNKKHHSILNLNQIELLSNYLLNNKYFVEKKFKYKPSINYDEYLKQFKEFIITIINKATDEIDEAIDELKSNSFGRGLFKLGLLGVQLIFSEIEF